MARSARAPPNTASECCANKSKKRSSFGIKAWNQRSMKIPVTLPRANLVARREVAKPRGSVCGNILHDADGGAMPPVAIKFNIVKTMGCGRITRVDRLKFGALAGQAG